MAWETVAKNRFPPFFGRDADFPDGSLQPERCNKDKRSFVTLTLRKPIPDEESTAPSTQRSSEVTNRDRKRQNGSLDRGSVGRDKTPEELLASTRSAPHGRMPDFSPQGPQVHGARHKQQGSLLLQSAPAQIRSLDSAGLAVYADTQQGRLATSPNGTKKSSSTKTVPHIPPLGRLSAHHDSLDAANIMSNNNGILSHRGNLPTFNLTSVDPGLPPVRRQIPPASSPGKAHGQMATMVNNADVQLSKLQIRPMTAADVNIKSSHAEMAVLPSTQQDAEATPETTVDTSEQRELTYEELLEQAKTVTLGGGRLSNFQRLHMQSVETRMKALPKIYCHSASGDIMELKMRHWPSLADRDSMIHEEANSRREAVMNSLPYTARKTHRHRSSTIRKSHSKTERQTTFTNHPGRAMHGVHGFYGIQRYIENLPAARKKAVQMEATPVYQRFDAANYPSVFEGKPAKEIYLPFAAHKAAKKEVIDMPNDRYLIQVNRDSITPHTGCKLYEDKCRELGVVPMSRVYEMLATENANLSNCSLNVKGGLALAACLPSNRVIKALNLSNNNLLEALQDIITALTMNTSVKSLDVSHNKFDLPASKLLASFVTATGLRELRVNGCGLSDNDCLNLSYCLSEGRNHTLLTLEMSGNQIGDSGANCIGDMLSSNNTLRCLDLSWNNFKAPGAKGLALGLRTNKALEYLNISWNGVEDEGGQYFGEMLKDNEFLKSLDMSHTRIGPEACMVISDGCINNSCLEELHLNYNPCGQEGGRHLMLMLQHNDFLQRLCLEGCSFVSSDSGAKLTVVGKADFHQHDADGNYTLDMASTSDKAIASFLCLLENEYPGSMSAVKMDGKKLKEDGSPPIKELNWPLKFPLRGIFTCTFKAKTSGQAKIPEPIEKEDLDNMTEQLASNNISDRARLEMLTLFSGSSYFLSCSTSGMLATFNPGKEKIQAAVALYFRILDAENCNLMLPAKHELKQMFQMLGTQAHFRAANPTGHYELNLQLSGDRMLGSKLVEASQYEGGAKTWRNITYEGKRLFTNMGPPPEWLRGCPTKGMLTLDYTSTVLPKAGQTAVTTKHLIALLERNVLCGADKMGGATCVSRLRECSVSVYITSEQLKAVVGLFRSNDERVEVCVILRSRVVDQENLWLAFYTLWPTEQMYLCYRLGWPVTLDLSHPTGRYFLNLKDPEQVAVMKQLTNIAIKEKGMQSLHNVFLNGRPVSSIAENSAMYSVLTMELDREGQEYFLEFDFFGPDIWDFLLITAKDRRSADLILGNYAKRRAMKRMIFYHPYWLMRLGLPKKRWSKGQAKASLMSAIGTVTENSINTANAIYGGGVGKNHPFANLYDLLRQEQSSRTSMTRPGSRTARPAVVDIPEMRPSISPSSIPPTENITPEPSEFLDRGMLTAENSADSLAGSDKGSKNDTKTQSIITQKPYDWQKGWETMIKEILSSESKAMDSHQSEHKATPLQSMFNSWDAGHKGHITVDEFIQGLRDQCGLATPGETLTEEVLNNHFHVFTDGVSTMSWEQFEQYCMTVIRDDIPSIPLWE